MSGDTTTTSEGMLNEQDSDSSDVISTAGQIELNFHEMVCKVLEKEPKNRTEEELVMLLQFTEHLPAFSNLTTTIKLQLCKVMVYAVVEESGTIILTDGEELDSWCVIINGGVHVEGLDGTTYSLSVGDCFGVKPTNEKMFHKGTMISTQHDTQFLCVLQEKYKRILENYYATMVKTETDGKLVCVFEKRNQIPIVIMAGTDWLINNLISDYCDSTFIPDFLITFRAFIDDPLVLPNKMLEWITRPAGVEKTVDLFIRWVTRHFTYFENNPLIWAFFHQFCNKLIKLGFVDKLNILALECSKRANRRYVSVEDSASFYFDFLVSSGGAFVTKSSVTLIKRGDRILRVNETSVQKFSRERISRILSASNKYTLVVQTDTYGFFQSLNLLNDYVLPETQCVNLNKSGLSENSTLGRRSVSIIRNIFSPEDKYYDGPSHYIRCCDIIHNSPSDSRLDVIKIYKTDKNFRYIPLTPEMDVYEAIIMALYVYKEHGDVLSYYLSEVSLRNNVVIKSRKLGYDASDLWNSLPVGSRYYINRNGRSQRFTSNETINEFINDGAILLENITADHIAFAVDVRHRSLFYSIDPFDYISDVCKLKNRPVCKGLETFTELCNTDMFWVISEICGQSNLGKRVKLISTFISVANILFKKGNFNASLAILGGLSNRAVYRLTQTWDRISPKLMKKYHKLTKLCDPLRNMACYRSALMNELLHDKLIIPYYPILRKDLFFINEANDSYINELVNFDKWRSMASQISKFYQYEYNKDQPYIDRLDDIKKGITIKSSMTTAFRRIYDDGIVVKKAFSYLNTVFVISDNDQLMKLSQDQEPSDILTISDVSSLSMLDRISASSPITMESDGKKKKVPTATLR